MKALTYLGAAKMVVRPPLLSRIGVRITLVLIVSMLVFISLFSLLKIDSRESEVLRTAQLELLALGSVVQSSINQFILIDRLDLAANLLAELKADSRIETAIVVQPPCEIKISYLEDELGRCATEISPYLDPLKIAAVSSANLGDYSQAGNDRLIAYLPITSLSKTVFDRERAVLVVVKNLSLGSQLFRPFVIEWIAFVIAILLVGFSIWFYLRARIGRPLTKLSQAIQELNEGVAIENLGFRGQDEIAELGRALERFSEDQRSAESKLRDAAQVFKSTIQGVMLTDKDSKIKDCNDAFSEITGYSKSEILGKTPAILRSGRHEKQFYEKMWMSLLNQGAWRGEIWNKRRSGEIYPELLTISAVYEANEIVGFVGVFSDISDIKRREDRIEYLTNRDALTGLPNKTLFEIQLEQAISLSERRKRSLAVVYLDIDRFKLLNDTKGMGVGDEILRRLSERISGILSSDDILARFGGDEFVLLLNEVRGPNQTLHEIDKILEALRVPFIVDDEAVHVSVSIGISFYPTDGIEPIDLIRHADAAMARAKQKGRDTAEFYTPALTDTAIEHFSINNALNDALDKNQFHLVYQPQIELVENGYIGVEALIRWEHPELGMVSPGKFIPIAESTGIIKQIGFWVLKSACTQAKKWADQGIKFGRVSINVAGPQFMQEDFTELLESVIHKTRVSSKHLELEVTESYLMEDIESAIVKLHRIRALGITVAIDDFGTGYSSLSYLKRLPVDKIKIDQSFVRELLENKDDQAIVRSIIALTKALNLSVIAEGVETEGQANFLRSLGCDEAQGYWISRPVLPKELWFNDP